MAASLPARETHFFPKETQKDNRQSLQDGPLRCVLDLTLPLDSNTSLTQLAPCSSTGRSPMPTICSSPKLQICETDSRRRFCICNGALHLSFPLFTQKKRVKTVKERHRVAIHMYLAALGRARDCSLGHAKPYSTDDCVGSARNLPTFRPQSPVVNISILPK